MTTIVPGTKIFIGGISNDIYERDLVSYFERFSRIADCVIMIDKKTSHSRGFGFITLEDHTKVESVLKSQPHIIKGKRVECKLAIPKDLISEQQQLQQSDDYHKQKPLKDLSFYYRKLFVGGLPLLMMESDMQRYFQRFGEVERCIIKKDEITGKPRGFGFVIFAHKEAIDVVLSYGSNHFVLGKWVECKIATPKEKRYASSSTSSHNTNTNTNSNPNANPNANQNGNMLMNHSDNPMNIRNLSTGREATYPNQMMNVGMNDNVGYYLNMNPNDNLNALAASPNNWSTSIYPNQNNLFQYQNYIPKKQKAFLIRQNSSNVKQHLENLNDNNSFLGLNNPKHIEQSPLTLTLIKKDYVEKAEVKSLIEDDDDNNNNNNNNNDNNIIQLKQFTHLNINANSSNNNTTTNSNLYTNSNSENRTIKSNSNSNSHNNSHSHSNKSNDYLAYTTTTNNIKRSNKSIMHGNMVSNYFLGNQDSNSNSMLTYNTNPNANNISSSGGGGNNHKQNEHGKGDTFSNYFNNCLQNPYCNSYFHYKLFDSNGSDVSKLIYKNSDKVTLFVDENNNQPRILFDGNPPIQITNNNTSNDNNNQLPHDNPPNTTPSLLFTLPTDDRERLQQRDTSEVTLMPSDENQRTETLGFHPEKDKSIDNSQNVFYKPY